MANPEWGAKRVCLACATKFYDFGRNPIVCPGCGNRYSPDDFIKPKRGSRAESRPEPAAAPARAKPRKPAVVDDELEGVEVDADDLDDDEEDLVDDDETEDIADASVVLVAKDDDAEDDDVLEPDEDEDEDLGAELSGEIDTEYRKEDVS